MILQAFEYEELENTPGRLQDFYDSTAGMTPVCVFVVGWVVVFYFYFVGFVCFCK